MCCNLGRLKPEESPSLSSSPDPSPSSITLEESRRATTMNNHQNQLTISTDDALASLLELAANDDVESFKLSIELDPCCMDEIGLWYCRRKGSKQMVNEQRTPLMVAATYASVGVMKLILAFSQADINQACGVDNTTALHCAASGGAANAVDAVKLLLSAGADPKVVDGNGLCPVDIIVVPPRLREMKLTLEQLLCPDQGSVTERSNLRVFIANSTHSNDSPPLSPSTENNGADSPMKYAKMDPLPALFEKKEYPIDPSLPDIKNSVYSTDDFRMYSFKVRPCSRAYSHDWTECPFVHPGENARRRDPRKYHYSCVPCPDFRKGACRRGDMCEYAHGVFECWLHPAQYRTRLCKDGTSCARRVCFFAHTVEELRPLYVTTGSAVPSPRSSATSGMDFAAAMSMLPPGSPSSLFTPPMSPSGKNGMSNAWGPQQQQGNGVPALLLPGGSSNLQSSRLRSSLHARDIPIGGDYNGLLPDIDMQIFDELSALTNNNNNNSLNRSGRMKILTPSNLDDLFSAETSSYSPRYADQGMVFSPTHKPSVLNHQFQQQQSMLSPINTSFSPRSVVDHPAALLQMSSPSNVVEPISPMSARISLLAQREKQQLRSLSSRELGSNIPSALIGGGGSPVYLSRWGSSGGRPDWTASTNELGKLRRSNSFELGNGDEPDLSWVQSLVKESPAEMKEKMMPMQPGSGSFPSSGESISMNVNSQIDSIDKAMGAWIEQLQIDQLVAQQN
ncbi:unnamed protein product [Linum trigynum]|uniref:C3H1-type domain-containing protein n=1 Tax=Linum trigynum TaxID=586398 RepID=A0AAV2CA60_9ROSI